MSQPANPWDRTPPTRPSTDDFHGIAKIDDAAYPPDPTTMCTAAEYNELCALLVAISQVVPNAKIDVTGGATPTIAQVRSPASGVNAATFTVTEIGTGHRRITWPSGTFPSSLGQPRATLNVASIEGGISAIAITNGVDVYTANGSGASTDLDFTVSVY